MEKLLAKLKGWVEKVKPMAVEWAGVSLEYPGVAVGWFILGALIGALVG